MRDRSSKFRDVLLASAIMLGAAAMGCAVVYWAQGTYQATFRDRRDTLFLAFRANGEPYLMNYSFTRSLGAFFNTDLAGNPIEIDRRSDSATAMKLPAQWPATNSAQPMPWSERIVGFAADQHPLDFWYLIHDGLPAGHAYFEGFSGTTKRRLGFIGTAGFREDAVPPAEQFPIRGGAHWNEVQIAAQYSHYQTSIEPPYLPQTTGEHQFGDSLVFLNGETTLYEIDLRDRKVRTPLPQTATPIRSIGLGSGPGGDWLGVRSDDAVDILEPDGRTMSLPLAPELRGRRLQVVKRDPTGFTVATYLHVSSDLWQRHVRVYSVASDGKLSSAQDVDISRASDDEPEMFSPFPYETPLLLGTPAVMLGSLLGIRSLELERLTVAPTWLAGASMAIEEYAIYLAVTVVAGLALAFACYHRQARYAVSRSERWSWPLFVFLFGVPGWIGYRYRRAWPVLEPCPACCKPAPRNAPTCAWCGREFPAPRCWEPKFSPDARS